MTYKVEIIGKDNLSEIRYIGNGDMTNMKKLIELDEFRDIANKIMHENPKVTYDRAFMMAKDLKTKTLSTPENQNEIGPQTFEKAKVKVLAIDRNAS